MENPFKKIVQNEKLPDFIKKKVMEDIDFIKLALDVTDLFVVKYPETMDDFFRLSNGEDKKD